MIGYPCTQEVIVSDAFSSILNEITIVKDNNGNVFMPEFSFNGIGFLEGGQGYQIKMTDFVVGFTFCQSIQFPTIEGCTDCAASNFNRLATADDGSCFYDSDGDGVPDSEEIVGCQDSLACDYNTNATDSSECTYAQEGYDCEGNINVGIGDEVFGGIVYYIDESGERGFVAAQNDIGPFAWGCDGQRINGVQETGLGYGYENTLDINLYCSDSIFAAKSALNFVANGYDDWYLPSASELLNMHSSIVFDGNFTYDYYWSSSEVDSATAWVLHFGVGEFL